MAVGHINAGLENNLSLWPCGQFGPMSISIFHFKMPPNLQVKMYDYIFVQFLSVPHSRNVLLTFHVCEGVYLLSVGLLDISRTVHTAAEYYRVLRMVSRP